MREFSDSGELVQHLALSMLSVLPSAYPDSVGAPDRWFRSSILSLHVPLSTLHVAPCDTSRMTRGQDSSLFLSSMTLSFTTRRRFLPAPQAKSPAPQPEISTLQALWSRPFGLRTSATGCYSRPKY